jgi:HlyD family type I secretion membrane fusion protein
MAKTDSGGNFSIRSRIATTILLAALLLGAGGTWAVWAKLSGAVIAHGRVVVKSQLKEVQHPDGGIIASIEVENGSRVEEGQIVMRLDPTQLRAELGIIEGQLRELAGRQARLRAQREGAEAVTFPAGFTTDPLTADIARDEMRLYEHDRQMLKVRGDQLSLQVVQYNAQVDGLKAQLTSNEAERRVIRADYDRGKALLDKGLMENTKFSALERDLARVEGSNGEIRASIAQVAGQINEAQLKLLELENQAQTQAQQDLREVDARIAELTERAVAARDKLSRTDLRAPIAGTVNDLAVHTVGGVIAPGRSVMAIVPDGELVVEARVPTVSVDQLEVGQAVRLRFSAFNQRTTPEVDGSVAVIGASASVDPGSGEQYYLSSISIGDVTAALGGKPLMPGMPVEVFFQTGERSALSYLVKPFADQMERSFREE